MKKLDKRDLEKKLLLKSETLRNLDLSVVTGGAKKEDKQAESVCEGVTCPLCSFTLDTDG